MVPGYPDAGYMPTILVVDDVPENLTLITDLLVDCYRCRVATSGMKALAIADGAVQPDLILLDINMPEMNGYEVCSRLKANPRTAGIPVLFLTALDNEDDETRGFEVGGVDYITKPVSRAVLTARVEAQLTLLRGKRFLSRKNEVLESMVEQRTRQLSTMQDVVIMAMASLAETRENHTGAHVRRVQCYTRELAVALRQDPAYRELITDEVLELLYKTSPLHDIGKVGVPDSILFKPGKLSQEEYAEMKQHSFLGGQTLLEVERQIVPPAAFVTMAHDIALHHHERWDGTGYPLGLQGEDIPLSARIVALADTYDALTSVRVYKPCYPVEDAAAIIVREKGRQFDPAVVDTFLRCKDAFRVISETYPDPDGLKGRPEALRHLLQ